MSRADHSDQESSPIRWPASSAGASRQAGSDDAQGTAWSWPGRAMEMVRLCCGIERYIVDSSRKSAHVAWVVGSAGLLSAGLFLLMKRTRMLSWNKRVRDGSIQPNMSTYDSVTGLPTQRLFMLLTNQAISRARASGRQVAVLMVEMDHFTLAEELREAVNNSLVYRVQAARVKSALRTSDTVARLGERTFAALLDNIDDTSTILSVAIKIQGTVSLPFILEGQEIFLTSRIGIALLPQDAQDAACLLDSAARAVAQARTEGYVLSGLPDQPRMPVSDSMTGIRPE